MPGRLRPRAPSSGCLEQQQPFRDQALAAEVARLSAARARIRAARSLDDRLRALDVEPRVAAFFGSALCEALYTLAGLVGKWSGEGGAGDVAASGEPELLEARTTTPAASRSPHTHTHARRR